MSVYLSIYLCLFTYLSIYLSIYVCLLIYLCLFTYLSIYLCLFTYLSIYVCLLIYLSIYVCLLIYLSMSVYLSIYLSMSVYLSIYLFIYLSMSVYISIYLSIYPSLYLSILNSLFVFCQYLSIYLSDCSWKTAFSAASMQTIFQWLLCLSNVPWDFNLYPNFFVMFILIKMCVTEFYFGWNCRSVNWIVKLYYFSLFFHPVTWLFQFPKINFNIWQII